MASKPLRRDHIRGIRRSMRRRKQVEQSEFVAGEKTNNSRWIEWQGRIVSEKLRNLRTENRIFYLEIKERCRQLVQAV